MGMIFEKKNVSKIEDAKNYFWQKMGPKTVMFNWEENQKDLDDSWR